MKKTVNVNINGRAFVIDENAYLLLDNYLKNLKYYFRKEEGADDIIADFESRIEELLSERLRLGAQVINKEHIEDVIARMGKPGDFTDGEPVQEEETVGAETAQENVRTGKKLFRNIDNKAIGGVFSGIAKYMNWNETALRIIAIILIFVTQFWMIPAYLIAWLIIPAARTASEKLQMQGKPVTVENIGKTVSTEAQTTKSDDNNVLTILLKIFLIGLGLLIGIPLLFVLFIIVVLFAALFGIGGGLLGALPFGMLDGWSFVTVEHPVMAMVTLLIVIGLPVVAIIYAIIAFFAKTKPLDKGVKWTLLAVWIISLILFCFSGFKLSAENSQRKSLFELLDRIDRISADEDEDYEYDDSDGNYVMNEQDFIIDDYIENIEFKDMIADVKIIQHADNNSVIHISGDKRLTDRFRYTIEDDGLSLSCKKSGNLKRSFRHNFNVTIYTPALKSINYSGIGIVALPYSFNADTLKINHNGVGKFDADSLFAKYLQVSASGLGAVFLAGQAVNCRLDKHGIGELDASDLIADSVTASVEGIGSLRCYPVKYLNGELNGIGKLSYKNEPTFKTLIKIGLGTIEKE